MTCVLVFMMTADFQDLLLSKLLGIMNILISNLLPLSNLNLNMVTNWSN